MHRFAFRSTPLALVTLTGALLLVTATLAATPAHASTGDFDTDFMSNLNGGAVGTTYGVVELDDGKLLVHGSFTLFNGVTGGLVRLLRDGRADATWPSTVQTNGAIVCIAVDSQDRIVIAGTFSAVAIDGGSPVVATRLARINADGSLDTTFTPTANGTPQRVMMLPDDSMIVAGWFTSINSTTVGYIARLDSTGALDTTFSANIGTGFNDQVRDAIMQSDGSVVALGQFTSFDGTSVQRIARISSTGTLDTTFAASTSLNGTGDHIVAFDDGRMLVSGSFTGVNGTTRNRLAVLDADGALDAAFDPAVGPDTAPNAIAIDQAGRVLLAGTLGSYAGTGVPEVCRVLADGGLDPAFALATAPDDTAVGVAVQSTGRILFCGAFTTFNATAAGGVAAIESDERVSLIESHDSNGTYAAGSVLTIRVTFTGPVTVTTAGGTPSLTLNSGGTATYTSGSATTTLAFSYTVATGETSSDLDVTVLALNGGTIVDGSSNAVSLLVPVAGLPGSLASNNQLVISAASSSSGSGTNGGCAATLQPGSVWRLDLLAMLLLALTGLAWRRRFGGSCGCAF